MIGKLANTIVRVIKYTFQHLVRNFWQSVLVILVVAVTLSFAQFFVLLSFTGDQVLTYLENQPQVLVFFRDEAQPDQILQIKSELESEDQIESVTYISKEQAVEIYKDLHRDEPELLEFVTPEILPASLEVSGTDIAYLAELATLFQNNQFVERVIFQRDLVREVLNLTNALRTAGMVIVGILAVVAAMIILLVVTNSVSAFNREIEIMQLVGAGRSYILWPFVLNAVLVSLIATTLASAVTYWLVPNLKEFVHTFIAPVDNLSFPSLFIIQMTQYAEFNLVFNLWVWTAIIATLVTAGVSLVATLSKLGK